MRIEKKEFNKLKVFDRIEFRQKFDYIESHCNIFEEIILAFLMFFGAYLISEYLILIGYFFLGIAIRDLYIRNKRIKELKNEYFKVEVK